MKKCLSLVEQSADGASMQIMEMNMRLSWYKFLFWGDTEISL